MRIQVEVVQGAQTVASTVCEVGGEESVEAVANRASAALGFQSEELISDLFIEEERLAADSLVKEHSSKGLRWRHHRECVDLHFESEQIEHQFPASWTWGKVHRWACSHFHVPSDACANLELRDGSPTGPALNENSEIGVFSDCKTVWLVKPGPEPNGGNSQ